MSKAKEYIKKTEALVQPIADDMGLEVVDVEFIKEAGEFRLRVYMDKEGGITIDDLTDVNHKLSDELDKVDFISESYILEVSSPGIFRPFKKKRDYEKNMGGDVEVSLYSPMEVVIDSKTVKDKDFIGILKELKCDDDDIKKGVITLGFDNDSVEIAVKDIAAIRRYEEF